MSLSSQRHSRLLLDGGSSAAIGEVRVRPASPLRRLYRMWRPIARSPEPRTPDEAHALQLIPAAALTERLARAICYLMQHLEGDLGNYVEFGVYNGSSMACALAALKQAGNPPMRLFGFDSFQGLPESAAEEDGGVWRPGQFSCPRSFAEERLKGAGADERVALIEGWYVDTLTKGDAYGVARASLVMIDSDTYSSARLALEFVGPLLTDPCILIFDDWRLNDLDLHAMGEYRAFHEWRARYPFLRCRSFTSYNRKSKMLVLRAR